MSGQPRAVNVPRSRPVRAHQQRVSINSNLPWERATADARTTDAGTRLSLAHQEVCSLLWKVLDSRWPGSASLPHMNLPPVSATFWRGTQPQLKSKASPGELKGQQSQMPACPEGHVENQTDCHLPFSTRGARGEPAAENTTVKPVIQRIQVSPNHRDLMRQVVSWQAAVFAGLPINAQSKAAFPPSRLNSGC